MPSYYFTISNSTLDGLSVLFPIENLMFSGLLSLSPVQHAVTSEITSGFSALLLGQYINANFDILAYIDLSSLSLSPFYGLDRYLLSILGPRY